MVYIDPLMGYGGSATFRWKDSCHMYADTLPELHVFAKSIGLKREWFQDHKKLKHYDLNDGRRRAAVKMGAEQTTLEHMVNHMRTVRQ